MSRPKKKPDYDPAALTTQLFNAISYSYNHPAADEAVDKATHEGEATHEAVGGHKKMELVAEEFAISRLKVRKILITTGDYSTPQTTQIKKMRATGKKTGEIAKAMNLATCTVTSLLPYEKVVYGLEELSVAADRVKLFRERRSAVEEIHINPSSINLWKAIILFSGYPFITSGRGSRDGVKFKYTIHEQPGKSGKQYVGESVEGWGNEMFIDGRNKSITRSSVDYALKIVLEGDEITGPKQLRIFGSSYVYAIFRRFGLV